MVKLTKREYQILYRLVRDVMNYQGKRKAKLESDPLWELVVDGEAWRLKDKLRELAE